MSRALPMLPGHRLEVYSTQGGRQLHDLTPKQRRRFEHKANRGGAVAARKQQTRRRR